VFKLASLKFVFIYHRENDENIFLNKISQDCYNLYANISQNPSIEKTSA
jgi:hypothetical protein